MTTFKQKAIEALKQELEDNFALDMEKQRYKRRIVSKCISRIEAIEEDGWIPVKERLPEHLGNYLTQGECGVAILIFKPKAGVWTGFNGMHEDLSVSKWMFLPPTN